MTLGILGMGGIGEYFAKMAYALPVKKVYYHNRHPKRDAPQWAEYVPSMEEFLKKVDVLSVHCPLNEHTVGLIGEKQIRTLKKGSIIINTARGKVIDEEALIRALKDGHVSTLKVMKIIAEFEILDSCMQLESTFIPTSRMSTLSSWNSATSRCCLTWALKLKNRKGRWKSGRCRISRITLKRAKVKTSYSSTVVNNP